MTTWSDESVRRAADAFLENIEQGERDSELALAWVESHRRRGDAAQHRVLAFRCKHGCSMLEVFPTPRGTILYFPRYKLSPERNAETSSPSGRAANTEDGDRRWKAHAGYLPAQDAWPGWLAPLACDHYSGTASVEQIGDALARHERKIICQ